MRIRIAYLIFAYMNPKLLTKTIERLSCSDATFFVHIDGKRDIRPFAHLQASNVVFVDKRIPVHWAEFSGVEAILLLIRQALSAPQPHDYYFLLSGSEYPIRSREYIHKFFEDNRGSEFITMTPVPAPGKPVSRINTLRFPSSRPVSRFLFRALAKTGLGQRDYRKHLGSLQPYSGLTWWTLSREACQYIVDFIERDRVLGEFLTDTFAPEETFFHTILGNSPLKARVRRNLLYEDWSRQGARPEMIDDRHLAFLESQDTVSVHHSNGEGEILFARKFSDKTLALTGRVDEMIYRKERH